MPRRIRQRKLKKKLRAVRTRKPRVKRRRGLRVSRSGKIPNWGKRAYAAGCYAVSTNGNTHLPIANQHKAVNQYWHEWYSSIQQLPWHVYHSAANQFIKGYGQQSQSGQHLNKWVLLPTNKTVSVIITAMNEKDTIPSILEQLHRLPLHEIIFVLNGSTDESFEMIRNQSWATIVHYHEPLGHDVGRAIGAKLSESEILVFLDGDFPINAEHLVPFIASVEQGMDIALNNITDYLGKFSDRDKVTTIKEFVNMSLQKEELGANSLTAIPHAMSRKAAQEIGYSNLAVPPKAQVIAMNKGMKIGTPTQVDVISQNKIRQRNVGTNNIVSEMIIGDHLEAMKEAMDRNGSRLLYQDHIRNRLEA